MKLLPRERSSSRAGSRCARPGVEEPINIGRRTERGMQLVRWRHVSLVFQGAMNSLDPVQRIDAQIAEAIRLHERVGSKERARAHRRAADDGRADARRSGTATRTSSRAASASG